jgi:hypothetical protein
LEEEFHMPFVSGFLRLRQRGRPDQGLPDGEGPVDPDYGIESGGGGIWPGLPDQGLPAPPPGVWPPLTPEHPWLPIAPGGGPSHPIAPGGSGGSPSHPIAPGGGSPSHPIELPPGTIWPPLPPGVSGKYLALVLIGGGGKGAMYRYVVVDADQRPEQPIAPGGQPGHPIAPGGQPEHPTAPGGQPTPRGRS